MKNRIAALTASFLLIGGSAAAQTTGDLVEFQGRREAIRARYVAAHEAGDLAGKRAAAAELAALDYEAPEPPPESEPGAGTGSGESDPGLGVDASLGGGPADGEPTVLDGLIAGREINEDVLDRMRRLWERYEAATSQALRETLLHELETLRNRRDLRREIAPDEPTAWYAEQSNAVTAAVGQTRFLQTANAGPCIIVTLYDPIRKQGSLAHFDASVEIESALDVMIDSLDATSGIEARVIGGGHLPFSHENYRAIIETLLADRRTSVVEREFGGGTAARPTSYSIQLDLETGTLADYVETDYRGRDKPGKDHQILLPRRPGRER